MTLRPPGGLLLECTSPQSDNPESKDSYIRAYENLEDIFKVFSAFVEGIQSPSYERYISSGWGIITIHPVAIEWNEPAEAIVPFILDKQLVSISHGTFHISSPLLRISEGIFEGRKTIDVSSEVINKAYDEMGYRKATQ